MTIDEAKLLFADLMQRVGYEMDSEIEEVRIKREKSSTTFNGKPYERSEIKVQIIFG